MFDENELVEQTEATTRIVINGFNGTIKTSNGDSSEKSVVEEKTIEEAPVEEKVEETPVEEKKEETEVKEEPKEEEKTEDAPVEEKKEETETKEEEKEESKEEEKTEKAPVEEKKEEPETKEEVKEEPKEEEKTEEASVEEKKEETEVKEEEKEEPKEEEKTEEAPVEEKKEETEVKEEVKEEPKEEEKTEEAPVEEKKEETEVKEESSDTVYDRSYLESNGVDVDHGLELLGDMEMYNMTISDFVDEIDAKWADINKFKEENNMPEYAILVHSLKSDCKYLGFMDLADVAYQHELKSKDNDSAFVNDNFAELEEKYNKYVKVAKEYVNHNK